MTKQPSAFDTTMANDERKSGGRRGFFREGFDSLVRSVFEAHETVAEVAEEVREVARGALGDEPVESGGRTFYRDRRKRVVAKDHEALAVVRDALNVEGTEERCFELLGNVHIPSSLFSAYSETLKSYQGTMPQFEAVILAQKDLKTSVLRHAKPATLAESSGCVAVMRQLSELTQDENFEEIASGLEGVAYIRETFSTHLTTLKATEHPLESMLRLQVLAACFGGRASGLMGLDDEDACTTLQEDIRRDGQLPRYLVTDLSNEAASRLIQQGRKANQAHRDAEELLLSALQAFMGAGKMAADIEHSDAFVIATCHSYAWKAA